MLSLRSARKRLIRRQVSFGIILLGALLLSSPSWAQCTSCESCPPPSIVLSSKQMPLMGTQNLTVRSDAPGSFTWSITSGGGSLSGSSGNGVIYTAPSSNANCTQNPAIQVTDFCGHSSSLRIAVHNPTYQGSIAYSITTCEPFNYCGSEARWRTWFQDYSCSNQMLPRSWGECDICTCVGCMGNSRSVIWEWCENACTCDTCSCEELVEHCKSANPWGCAMKQICDLGINERRTAELISLGCCPSAKTTCLNITSFSADAQTINLTSGQKVHLTGNISVNGGGTTSWAVIVERLLEEGGGYQTVNVLNGSGNSVSKEWDGKDSSQKQVAAGNYRVSLAARNTGGTCGDDSDFKSMAANIIVTATQPMAKTWPACLANLKVKTESSVNLASGNLSHSQPLFTLPNSKFPREFRLSYNSLSSQDDVLGLGWTHTYNIRLAANNDGSYTLTDGDGEKTVLHNKGSYYSPQNWNYPALTISGGTYTLQHKDGITYSFDSDKKITAISDRNSNTISFTYTGNNLTSVTDPNGRNVTLTYSSNKINTISDPSSNVHTFSYSGQNLIGVSSQIVVVGTSSWTYTYYDNSFMHTKTDPLNMTTTYYYDSDNRLIQSIDPESKDRSFVYNPAQSLTQMTEKDSGVWKFKYDVQLGTLTEKEDPYGYKEKYGFFPSGDPNYGRLQHIEDQRGKRNWFTYDSSGNGNITSVTDALNNRTDYTYNSLHKVTRIEYPGSPRPMVDMNYNAQGNLTYFKDPMGNETQFTNDTRGNLTGIQSIGNSLVNMTYTYDSSNYLRTMTDNRTGAQTQLEHDSAGNLRVHKDPMTPTNDTVFEYNGFSKVKRVTDPEGNIINFYYDLMGNLASMTDANLKSTSYEYNYRGQVTKITDALNNITQFAYGSGCPSCATGVEKLTSVTDARGKTTTFEYDLAGRLIKETDHLGKFKTYAYDVPLNKITKTDEDGVVIHYTHDDLYRLTQISYPNSTTATFGYDARGNMISAANPNISYNPLTYDLNNRLTSVLDSNGKTISYQYNALNQRTQVTTPDGRTITYGYDNGNRLGQITTPVGVFNISYDLAGRRQTLSYPNLVTTTYTPNKAGFLTNLLTRYNEQTTINSFVYTPDGMSNRTNMTDLAGVHNYTYDNTYQLAQATHPNMPLEQFTYDEVGNRLSSQGQAPGSGMSTEFVYDFDNRLIEVNYTGMLAQYKYDPFGRRIEKNVNGAITRYLYDGPNIVTEYDGAWNVTAKYTHTIDIDDPLTITQGANTYYYHKDGLGSIVNLTNSDGNVVKNYTYKSFGEIYSETGSLVQPFTFTGREYDPESGLYFYRARYYDPRAGRFLTKDPIRFAGGDVNLYRYLGNNPINRTDPSGLRFFPYHFVETFIGATIIGHGPSTAFMWALESVMTDFEPGSQDSPLAQDTNVHGLKGLLGVNDRLQTMEEYWQGVRDAISGSTERGRYGRACHTLQDKNAIGHRNETYNGELTFGHALWDLSPMETPKNIHDTAKYLWENAPPSLPRRAYQFIFGR